MRALTGRTAERRARDGALAASRQDRRAALDGVLVAMVGVVDPRLLHAYEIGDDVVAAGLDIERAAAASRSRRSSPPSRFPADRARSRARLAADVAAGDVLAAVRAHADVRSGNGLRRVSRRADRRREEVARRCA